MKYVVITSAGLLFLNACSEMPDQERGMQKPAEPAKVKEVAETKQKAKTSKPTTKKMPEKAPQGDARYIGMPVKEAMELAKSEGRRARVIKEDGEHRITTRDYRPERLNFVVVDGKVTEVSRG